jgi:hypothetical protein
MIERLTQTPESPRKKLSQTTSALYPELCAQYPSAIVQDFILQRAKDTEKDVTKFYYGSPNHGDQYWIYRGKSMFFNIPSNARLPDVQDEETSVDDIVRGLRTKNIALFTPSDVRNAKNLGEMPNLFKPDLENLYELVAKDGRNGIILLTK